LEEMCLHVAMEIRALRGKLRRIGSRRRRMALLVL